MSKKNNRDGSRSTNGWDALQNVLIASMSKGQFPLALVGLLIGFMVYRMPSADVSKLVFEILSGLEGGSLIGYTAGGLLLVGWFVHAKFQRKWIYDEMDRIAQEKSKLQEGKIGKNVKSSTQL